MVNDTENAPSTYGAEPSCGPFPVIKKVDFLAYELFKSRIG
jgi:hypothetical protein